jgi:hypothetical protein
MGRHQEWESAQRAIIGALVALESRRIEEALALCAVAMVHLMPSADPRPIGVLLDALRADAL